MFDHLIRDCEWLAQLSDLIHAPHEFFKSLVGLSRHHISEMRAGLAASFRHVSPADLFTKRLPSSVKIEQLVKLLGCECRQGRSAAAPVLRPLDSAEGQGGQPSGGHLPAFVVACEEVEAHDIEMFSHLYSEDDVDRLLPRLEAPAPGPNIEDWEPSVEE